MISARKRQQLRIDPPPFWQSHAPGSLMLFGEHAVLQGYPAIACAIDHWLHIDWTITPDQTGRVDIFSSLAEHHTSWAELAPHPKLAFLMAGLQWLKQYLAPFPKVHLPSIRLHIHSDISSTQGLGSSSAVMAGLLAGFAPLLPEPLSLEARFVIGRDLIRQVQGSGSGTDLASALLGGVIQLTPLRNEITRLADDLPLTSVYVGYKTPTAEVIRRVTDDWQRYPDLYQHQLMSMSQLTHQAQEAIHARDLARLGRLMTMAHGLMHGLGVSDTQLDALVHQLRACDGILGAKISGSGLGDCVIALGKTTQYFAQEVPVTVTPKGAYHD